MIQKVKSALVACAAVLSVAIWCAAPTLQPFQNVNLSAYAEESAPPTDSQPPTDDQQTGDSQPTQETTTTGVFSELDKELKEDEEKKENNNIIDAKGVCFLLFGVVLGGILALAINTLTSSKKPAVSSESSGAADSTVHMTKDLYKKAEYLRKNAETQAANGSGLNDNDILYITNLTTRTRMAVEELRLPAKR